MLYRDRKVALVVPCFNEEAAIETVVTGFRAAMPELDVYVFDNRSTDQTVMRATQAGAKVIHVGLRGKGNVVRRMFADVDADIYVMVDGDATYDPAAVGLLVDKLIDEHLDMVVACREVEAELVEAAYRSGHQWGNRLLTGGVRWIFGGSFTDMLSGYRAFSRRYVKSFPAMSHGFETETELTVHALSLRMPYGELLTRYGARPEGSASKLSTYRDGLKIVNTIFRLFVRERPFVFFSICAIAFFVFSLFIFAPVLEEYLVSGLVPRLPTAVLSASLMVCSLLSFFSGLILDNVVRGRQEIKRFAYLNERCINW